MPPAFPPSQNYAEMTDMCGNYANHNCFAIKMSAIIGTPVSHNHSQIKIFKYPKF